MCYTRILDLFIHRATLDPRNSGARFWWSIRLDVLLFCERLQKHQRARIIGRQVSFLGRTPKWLDIHTLTWKGQFLLASKKPVVRKNALC